jgi:hypothetical protein
MCPSVAKNEREWWAAHEIDRLHAEIELLRGYRDNAESDAAVAHLLVDRYRMTDAEREAVEWAAKAVADPTPVAWYAPQIAATLRGLLERTGDCPEPDNAADRDSGTTAGR